MAKVTVVMFGKQVTMDERQAAAFRRTYNAGMDALEENGAPADARQAAITNTRREREAVHWAIRRTLGI